ncbi:ribonuclease H-like domain-containing protein [Tanacetum coccineum]
MPTTTQSPATQNEPVAQSPNIIHDPPENLNPVSVHPMVTHGTLSRYKARFVVNGSTQLEGVDVDETFSLVVKPCTIRTLFSLAASQHWPIHQLDVKNAFLHGDLSEIVYMHQPPGFEGTDTAYLLLYVDDIVLTASSEGCSLQYSLLLLDQGPVWRCDKLVSRAKVMETPVISISSNVSVKSVGSSFPRVILIGSISVEVPIAPEVGAAAVASLTGVLELDTHSSLEADPSESSPPPISVAPMVSPFLCPDDSESDTKIPERHVSPTPHDAMLTRWRSRVAS